MKAVICIFTEGNETKAAALTYENGKIKILKVASSDNPIYAQNPEVKNEDEDKVKIVDEMPASDTDDISLEGIDSDISTEEVNTDNANNVEVIAQSLKEFKLKNFEFIAVSVDPAMGYYVYDKPLLPKDKNFKSQIIDELLNVKGVSLSEDLFDHVTFTDKHNYIAYLEAEVPSISFINKLANKNRKRYYKISAIKSGEIALVNLVQKTAKFFPEDYSLIIYTGKEYSRLLFLEGQNLVHIGATLDIGTKNLHTYDVYFSKILLEMENGNIPRLDNVILCGDDSSENLLLSFYGTFPEANVINLNLDLFDSSLLNNDAIENLSSFSMVLAAGYEYFEEWEKRLKGISILPKKIKENQKFFQFSWHSYAMLPLLFAATFYFTVKILTNYRTIADLNIEISRLEQMERENENILSQIVPIEQRIAEFDKTTALLDSAMSGTEIWNNELFNISQFIERKRNFWFNKFEGKSANSIVVNGITLSRLSVTKFVEQNSSAVLQNMIHEPIRDKAAYTFIINYSITQDTLRRK
ncbi:MAG TPA: hypothetical protein PL041_08345 [Melioribacteraceae bacterium]|nr:hypothetical protein [Melioribacteraceae bacterium]